MVRKLDTVFCCASMEPLPKPFMTLTRTGLVTSLSIIGLLSSVTPAFAAYRGISHDAPGYDSSGRYHSVMSDRLGGVSICTAYDEEGRCLRTQVYRNNYDYAKDFPRRTTKKIYPRMDHTYVDQFGERHYDLRYYRVYDCGNQFRPEACTYDFKNRYYFY